MLHTVTTRTVTTGDLSAISRLHAEVFGPGRFVRSAYRVREGKGLMSRFCRLADLDGRLIAAVRVTEIRIGDTSGAALLGPVAVGNGFRDQGVGRRLIAEALDAMKRTGMKLVVLVGDEPYYGKLGFIAVPPGQITFPGPVNPARILAAELEPGTLAAYRGSISVDPNADAGKG